MILNFFVQNGVDYVSHDDNPPMAQQKGGCRAMFQMAEMCGGRLSISDKKLDGWTPGLAWDGSYIYPQIPNFGYIHLGHIEQTVMDAIGFNPNAKGGCWQAENNMHLCNAEQYRTMLKKYPNPGKDRDEYLLGLFPKEAPEPAKKSKRRRGEAEIALV